MKNLSECVKNFNNNQKQTSCFEQLFTSTSPLMEDLKAANAQSPISRRVLSEVLNSALYETLRKALVDQVDADTAFAWRVFNNDYNITDTFGLREKRPSKCKKVIDHLFKHHLLINNLSLKIHQAQVGVQQRNLKKKLRKLPTKKAIRVKNNQKRVIKQIVLKSIAQRKLKNKKYTVRLK
jgi:hypothetical protein